VSKNSRLVGRKCEFAERSLLADSLRQHRHICGFLVDGMRLNSPAHCSDRVGTRAAEQFKQRATGLASHFQHAPIQSQRLMRGMSDAGPCMNVPDIPHLPAALVEKKENGELRTRYVVARFRLG
jgi:hypothetical protein